MATDTSYFSRSGCTADLSLTELVCHDCLTLFQENPFPLELCSADPASVGQVPLSSVENLALMLLSVALSLQMSQFLVWIQGPFTVEPPRHDSGLIFSKMIRISPPKIRVTARKSEIQAKNRRYWPRIALKSEPNRQRRCPSGFSVFLQKRALKPL